MTKRRDVTAMFRELVEKPGNTIASVSRRLGFSPSYGGRVYKGTAKLSEDRREQVTSLKRGHRPPELVRQGGALVPRAVVDRPAGAPPLRGVNHYRYAKHGGRVVGRGRAAGWVTDPAVGPGDDLLRAVRKAAREGRKVALMVAFGSLQFTDYPNGLPGSAPDTLPMFQPGFAADLPGGPVNGPIDARRLLRELGDDPAESLAALAMSVRKGSMPPGAPWVTTAEGPHTITVHARD